MNKPIGTITYLGTGVTFGYYTEDEYIAAIDSALDYLGITGWKYTTYIAHPGHRVSAACGQLRGLRGVVFWGVF